MKIEIDENVIADAVRRVAVSELGRYEFQRHVRDAIMVEVERNIGAAIANAVAATLPGIVADELELLARKAVRKAVREGRAQLPLPEPHGSEDEGNEQPEAS